VNDWHFGYITESLKRKPCLIKKEPSGISKTWTQNNTGRYIHAFDQQLSKAKKLGLTVWPLDPAVFSKTIRPVWKLAMWFLRIQGRGGQRTYPKLLALLGKPSVLFRFFLGNPEVLWGVWNNLEMVGSLILSFKYPE
jgi:hypothetical protein